MNPNQTTANPNPGLQGTIEATFLFPDFSNLIKKEYAKSPVSTPIDALPFFIYQQVPNGQGDSKQVNEVDFTRYAAAMPEGTNARKGSVGSGFHKQVLWFRYGQEYDITYKMRTAYQWYDVVPGIVQALKDAVPQRQNLDMTHLITFGQAVGYYDQDGYFRDTTTGDELSLFNTAHKLAFSTKTYSNLLPGSLPFNKAALESMGQMTTTEIMDNFGKLGRMNFNTIFCAQNEAVINSIRQYIHSVADPSQANPSVENPYKGRYELRILSMLATDANGNTDYSKLNWWGIAALGTSMSGDRWQAYRVNWEPTRLKGMSTGNGATFSNANWEDFHNDNVSIGVRGTENYAALAGKGIILSPAPNA